MSVKGESQTLVVVQFFPPFQSYSQIPCEWSYNDCYFSSSSTVPLIICEKPWYPYMSIYESLSHYRHFSLSWDCAPLRHFSWHSLLRGHDSQYTPLFAIVGFITARAGAWVFQERSCASQVIVGSTSIAFLPFQRCSSRAQLVIQTPALGFSGAGKG